MRCSSAPAGISAGVEASKLCRPSAHHQAHHDEIPSSNISSATFDDPIARTVEKTPTEARGKRETESETKTTKDQCPNYDGRIPYM